MSYDEKPIKSEAKAYATCTVELANGETVYFFFPQNMPMSEVPVRMDFLISVFKKMARQLPNA